MRFIKRIVVLFGPPFSGKGTVGARLAEEFGLVHVETGRLIDLYVPGATKLKQNGNLTPDDIMLELFKKHVVHESMVIDSPRSVRQLAWISDHMSPDVRAAAIKLDLRAKLIEERLALAAGTSRGLRVDDGALKARLADYPQYAREVVPVLRHSYPFREVDASGGREEVYEACRAGVASYVRR